MESDFTKIQKILNYCLKTMEWTEKFHSWYRGILFL